MLTYWEILTAIQSNVPVNDSYAQLWGRKSRNNYRITTYTGALPATLANTKAGYLHRYKIYGNTVQDGTPTPSDPIIPQECGERTGNLFNGQGTDNYGYYQADHGTYINDKNYKYWKFPVKEGDIIRWTTIGAGWGCLFSKGVFEGRFYASHTPFTVPANIDEITSNFSSTAWESAMVTKNQPLPNTYIPYGYKLPLTSAGQDVDIYIGDDTISTEEYVDSGTGKVYRMVGGVLTPVDPPVPFPPIPTSANSTTISWTGEGLAPSQVDLKYEKRR